MLNVLRDNCIIPPLERKNRVFTQLFLFRTDKNSRKLRSPYGCLCNWETHFAIIFVRLMYLQSGVHLKHFSPLCHPSLEKYSTQNVHKCFIFRKQQQQQQQQNRHTPSSNGAHGMLFVLNRWESGDVSHVHCTLYAQFHLINAIIRLLLGLFKFQYIWNFHEFS